MLLCNNSRNDNDKAGRFYSLRETADVGDEQSPRLFARFHGRLSADIKLERQ
jgi:hypothetical protein